MPIYTDKEIWKERGLVWTKCAGPTVLSALTDVLIGGENLKLPAEARSILAIIPHCQQVGGQTTAEFTGAKVTLKSDDFPIDPYIVLTEPVGSCLGAKSGSIPQMPAPIYPVNVPVKGGSELKIYGTGLIDHTIEPYVAVDVIVASFVAKPRFKAKVGTLTTMSAATAGETKGSGIRLTGGRRITEVMGYVIGTTVAASKGIFGKFRLSSAGFKGMGDVQFVQEPIGGTVAIDATTAVIQEFAKLTRRRDLNIPITDPIDIDDYYNLGIGITTAGKFIVGVIYT